MCATMAYVIEAREKSGLLLIFIPKQLDITFCIYNNFRSGVSGCVNCVWIRWQNKHSQRVLSSFCMIHGTFHIHRRRPQFCVPIMCTV